MEAEAFTITIGPIDCKPVHDPYINLEGHHSQTVFWFDPSAGKCGVKQDYKDYSTPADVWQHLVLETPIEGHPQEEAVKATIEARMSLLLVVQAGFLRFWDGSNHIGALNHPAVEAWAKFCTLINENVNFYEYWYTGDWIAPGVDEITGSTSDTELAQWAERFEASTEANIALSEPILFTLTALRDKRKERGI